jgi:hypothetical protein
VNLTKWCTKSCKDKLWTSMGNVPNVNISNLEGNGK